MTIAELGSIAEFFGLFAVVVSLWYLAIQTRSANEVALAEAQRELIAGFNVAWSRLEQDRELLRLVRIGVNDWGNLKKNEQAAVHALFSQLFSNLSAVLRQQQLRGIGEFVQAWEDVLLGILICPGGKAWWQEAQYLYFPPLVTRLNARVQRSEDLPPSWVEGLSCWKTEDADFAGR